MSEPYRRWRCLNYGLVYDEAVGWPEDWICPQCGSPKIDFAMAAP